MGLFAAMSSKQVLHIKAEVGATFPNRTSRPVSLSGMGAICLAAVRPLLEGLDEADARPAQSTIDPCVTLRISLPVWLAEPGPVRVRAAFRARYPAVLLGLDLSRLEVNRIEDGCDRTLRVSPALDEGLIARRLAEATLHIVAAPALPDRIGRPKHLDDPNGAPLLA